jgi:hypothetical protein
VNILCCFWIWKSINWTLLLSLKEFVFKLHCIGTKRFAWPQSCERFVCGSWWQHFFQWINVQFITVLSVTISALFLPCTETSVFPDVKCMSIPLWFPALVVDYSAIVINVSMIDNIKCAARLFSSAKCLFYADWNIPVPHGAGHDCIW